MLLGQRRDPGAAKAASIPEQQTGSALQIRRNGFAGIGVLGPVCGFREAEKRKKREFVGG